MSRKSSNSFKKLSYYRKKITSDISSDLKAFDKVNEVLATMFLLEKRN